MMEEQKDKRLIIKIEDGKHLLFFPDGERLPHIFNTVVRQDVKQARAKEASVSLSFAVNIDGPICLIDGARIVWDIDLQCAFIQRESGDRFRIENVMIDMLGNTPTAYVEVIANC